MTPPNPVRYACDHGHLHPSHRAAEKCNRRGGAKLTVGQIEALRALAQGARIHPLRGFPDSGQGGIKKVAANTITALARRGLIVARNGWQITDAGRAAMRG